MIRMLPKDDVMVSVFPEWGKARAACTSGASSISAQPVSAAITAIAAVTATPLFRFMTTMVVGSGGGGLHPSGPCFIRLLDDFP